MTRIAPPPRSDVEPGDIDESLRGAVRRLAAAQKHAVGAPAYSRWINRRAGRVLAALAYKVGLSPNQVSSISGAWSFLAIVMLATMRPTPLVGIGVTLALLIGYAFDSADGQLARLLRASSKSGEWLDHMIDCAKIATMHLAVLIGVFRFGALKRDAYLLMPIAFSVVTVVLFFGMILNDQLRRAHAATTGVDRVVNASPSKVRAIAIIPTDFGVVCCVFVLWGWTTAFLVGYGLLLIAHVGFLLLALVKWFRDMAALDHGQTRP